MEMPSKNDQSPQQPRTAVDPGSDKKESSEREKENTEEGQAIRDPSSNGESVPALEASPDPKPAYRS